MSHGEFAMANEDVVPNPTPVSADKSLLSFDFGKKIEPLTLLAMAAGLALILLQVFGKRPMEISSTIANVLIGSGVAIILAAFGGQATVRGKGIVFAGVAGIAAGLIAFLFYSEEKNRAFVLERSKSYLSGSIDDLPREIFKVSLKFKRRVPGSQEENEFNFADQLKNMTDVTYASLEIEERGTERPRKLKIDRNCILASLDSDNQLLWGFDASTGTLSDRRSNSVISRFEVEPTICESRNTLQMHIAPLPVNHAFGGTFFSAAFAQVAIKYLATSDIEKVFHNLSDEDSDIRRNARDDLSTINPVDVPFLLRLLREALAKDKAQYRKKLGVAIALTELLRRDKSAGSNIPLQTEDVALLLEFAGSGDRTLRIYAGEFLFDLESPDVTKQALPLAAGTTNDDARFNWLLVAQGGWRKLSLEERKPLLVYIESLHAVTGDKPKTAELLKNFI